MSKPKLLFVAHTDNLRGGGELSVIELMSDAKKRGYSVFGVVPGNGDFAARLGELGIDFAAFKYSYWGRPADSLEAERNLNAIQLIVDIIKTRKIDCVISNTLMIPWGALAAALTDTPHVWISRELLNLHHGHLKDHYDFIGAFSNLVIANSKSNANYIRETGGLSNVGQFYSFVDPGKLKLGQPEAKPRIVCIAARIHPDKNQMELLHALAMMKKSGKLQHKTVLLGGFTETDKYYKQARKFITESGLEPDVEFGGFVADPFSLVGPDDVFVRTSKHESLGRAITEAMKLGLITVAADIPDSKEAFELGGGCVYKSDDPSDLANLLEKILASHAKYLKAAKQVQKKVVKNLTMDFCHAPFFSELDKCLGQPNPRREVRHMAELVNGLSLAAAFHAKELSAHQATIEKKQHTIDQIINSKGWKMVEKARSVKNAPRNAVKKITGKQGGA